MAAGKPEQIPRSKADELALAERLMRFDSSEPQGIRACADWFEGWLDANAIPFEIFEAEGLPVFSATVGQGPVTIVLHAHLDVVPAPSEQFEPRRDGDWLWGRGAYDMKGAMAAMLAVMADIAAFDDDLGIAVRLVVVSDEESDALQSEHGTEVAVERGHVGDFVICGEPTDMHVGIQAKGVLDVRVAVDGRAAHGATPWLGVNAIVKAMDVFEALLRLPFAYESSQFFDRPSINLGRISGGDRINQVPDKCIMDVDIRFLPEQPLSRLREELQSLPGCSVHELVWRPPAKVSVDNAFLERLRECARSVVEHEVQLVGRDGTNDGVHFLKRGIPSVEFGPVGSGHHGPKERVSISSLSSYRDALSRFIWTVSQDKDSLVGLTRPTQ